MSSTGGYPWLIDERGSTIVFIKNSTKKPQKFHLDLIYPGGEWGSNLKTLSPGQTFKMDVREIRDSQVIGSEGNTVPPDAAIGHVYWSVFGTGDKTLIGRAQIVSIEKGLTSTYECQCACSASYGSCRLTPPSVIGYPGDSQLFLPQQQNVNCFGTPGSWFDVSIGGVSFSSQYPSVATIASNGQATALDVGTTNLYASWTGTIYYWNGFGCTTQLVSANASASCEVQCLIPTHEDTIITNWDTIALNKHKWVQRLFPVATSFTGRRVYEEDPGGGGPDTCHQQVPNSIFDPFVKITNPPSWYWTVAQGTNEWGPDTIGYPTNAVPYYRARVQLPCSTKFKQRMLINCGSGKQQYITPPHEIRASIGATTVSVGRAEENVTRNYP